MHAAVVIAANARIAEKPSQRISTSSATKSSPRLRRLRKQAARIVKEPGWWKGIHGGLKIRRPQGHVGSNPTPGTNNAHLRLA